jgi:hypothetical protein
MFKTKFVRVGVAFGATVAGLVATAALSAPAATASTTSTTSDVVTAAAERLAAERRAADRRRDADCRVRVDRRDDSATAFCRDLRRGTGVTLNLVCERHRGWHGRRYVARDSERVRRGPGWVWLSVECRRGFDAGRAWVDLDRRGWGRH